MRLPIACPLCGDVKDEEDIQYPELTDDNVYQITCHEGHEFAAILWKLRFELLVDFGVKAFQDGYYREALANMASALERFYEFYINVICLKRGIAQDEIKKTWSEVSSQSERQLGAFLFLYLLENLKPITPLPSDLVKLRNDVIHKGKIPSRENAALFGERVMEVISTILVRLQDDDREWMDHAIKAMCPPKKGRISDGTTTYAFIYEGIVNITMPNHRFTPITFQQAVESFHDVMGGVFVP